MNEEELELESTLRTRRAQVNDEQWLEQAEAREMQERRAAAYYWNRPEDETDERWRIKGVWLFWVSTIVSGAILAAAISICAYGALYGGAPTP